tara:strand:+ start:1826 stop:2248 length:423 start_codon:yes stop_codon:yes gene_type:complete
MIYLLLCNAFLSSLMFGVILTTQVVSYPMFLAVNSKNFSYYHSNYVSKISIIAAPIMLLELFFSIVIVVFAMNSLSIILLLSTCSIFLSTFFIQVPLHDKIKNTYNVFLFKKLINTNILRTFLWMFKTLLSLIILSKEVL